MFANVIFVVTKALTEIFASSAFSSVIRRTGTARPHDVGVAGGEMLAGFVVELADQQEIRIQEIADDACRAR